jgi:hypothetical protein
MLLAKLSSRWSHARGGRQRADSVWIFSEMWITLEAKSETSPGTPVSMEEVRQANTQLRSLSADRGDEPPTGSVSVIISPKELTDPDAVDIAEPHLYLSSPEQMANLAGETIEAWRTIRANAMNVDSDTAESTIRQALADRQLLASRIRERITALPIRGA